MLLHLVAQWNFMIKITYGLLKLRKSLTRERLSYKENYYNNLLTCIIICGDLSQVVQRIMTKLSGYTEKLIEIRRGREPNTGYGDRFQIQMIIIT